MVQIMRNKIKGGIVSQKSTLETFNPEDAARGEIFFPNQCNNMLRVIIELQHYKNIERAGEILHGREARFEIIAKNPEEVGRFAKQVAEDFEKLDSEKE